MINYKVYDFPSLNVYQLYDVLQLREEVFVIEQNCIYQDIDSTDKQVYHLLGYTSDHLLVAYCRIIPPGIKYPGCSIGRVVVKKAERLNKHGIELMKEAIAFLHNKFPGVTISISAQLYLKSFYMGFGFIPEGEVYDEDGIPHIKMNLNS